MRARWKILAVVACAMVRPAAAAPAPDMIAAPVPALDPAPILDPVPDPRPAVVPDGPPLPDIRVTRTPVLGSEALDPLFHDPSVYAPDPLPIETGAALDDLVLGQIPQAVLLGPDGAEHGVLERVEHGGIGRLARRIGGDEIVVPVWTLHFPGRR